MPWYAVRIGRKPGIYTVWSEAKEQIFKFPKATYKSFPTLEEAEAFLNNSLVRSGPTAPVPECIVYTDGSRQGKWAGAGVWFGPDDPRNLSLGIDGVQTNQRAEAYGLLYALQATRDIKGLVEIRSDSMYAINAAVAPHTEAHDDVFTRIRREIRNRLVRFIHVYAHRGEPGNEGADQLATRASQEAAKRDKTASASSSTL